MPEEGKLDFSDVKKTPKKVYPKKIKLRSPHGFVDDDGSAKHWFQNQVIDDPSDIQTFYERGFLDFDVCK